MPKNIRADSHTGITAEHERKLRRHGTPLAFNPNEDPVVIGAAATAGGGSSPSAVTVGAAGCVVIGAGANCGADGTTITEQKVIVIGPSATAYKEGDIAIGWSCSAGHSETSGSASSGDCIAIGTATQADGGSGALAMCRGANASAASAIAIGYFSDANNTSAAALGWYSVAHGSNALAIGSQANASHTLATAVGPQATTTKANQIMLGAANGTVSTFVEIPGNGSANGLVLKDTATGTRYLVQITSAALVLNTAP